MPHPVIVVIITSLIVLLDRPKCSTVYSAAVPETLNYNLTELLPVGTPIGNVRADSGLESSASPTELARMRFDIQSSTGPMSNGSITINRTTGLIVTAIVISRNAICPYQTTCDATIYVRITPIDLFRLFKVVIAIVDVNDATPTFPVPARKSLSISQQLQIGSTFPLPAADDRDSPANNVKLYRAFPVPDLVTANSSQPFDVRTVALVDGSTDVRLVLVASVGVREGGGYRLSVLAVDGGLPPKTGTLLVEVSVTSARGNGSTTASGGAITFDSNGVFTTNLTENSPVGTFVARVSVTGASLTRNGQLVYGFDQLTASQYGKIFRIDNATGNVSVIGNVDREQLVIGGMTSSMVVCSLVIVATDLGSAYARLLVAILDVNDNSPSVYITDLTGGTVGGGGASNFVVTGRLPQNSVIGTPVVYISVEDSDSGMNAVINCHIDVNMFRLDPAVSGSSGGVTTSLTSSDYVLSTAVTFDRGHPIDPYSVVVTCSDRGSPSLTTVRRVNVSIVDAGPTISSDQIVVDFPDQNSVGDVITTVRSTTTDTGPASTPGYRIDALDSPSGSSSAAATASIGFRSGVVVAGVAFPRHDPTSTESLRRSYRYLVTATDSGLIPLSATTTLTVRLTDSTPYFDRPAYAFAVSENQPIGTTVGQVTARVDSSTSGCWYSAGMGANLVTSPFAIEKSAGVVTTSGRLYRSNTTSYSFVVSATNVNRPRASSSVNVTVFVVSNGVDVTGSGAPVYFTYPSPGGDNVVRIASDAPVGLIVVQLSAISRSSTSTRLIYGFVGGNGASQFTIDPATGVLRTAVSGNLLSPPGTVYTLAVSATSTDGSSAVASLVIVVVTQSATTTTLSSTPTVAGAKPGGSSESTWWSDNGVIVIATSASVSAAIVVGIVIFVACFVCRLRNSARKLEKQPTTSEAAPSIIGSDGLPRTLPSSRASTPFYLDDLCSCSRRSSRCGRGGGSSRMDDSFDAGFSVRLDGSSSSGVFCSGPGSSVAEGRSISVRATPTHGAQERGPSPRKYDSDSGVETSYQRQFTPTRGSDRSGSASGNGMTSQRLADRRRRTSSSTSPTGSRGTNRSSTNGSVRCTRHQRKLTHNLELEVTDGLETGKDGITSLPSTFYMQPQQPVIVAGQCTVTVSGTRSSAAGGSRRRSKYRRSSSYRHAPSSSSSDSELRSRLQIQRPVRPASSSPPRHATSRFSRGSSSAGGSPTRAEPGMPASLSQPLQHQHREQRQCFDIGLAPRSPLHKFSLQLLPPLQSQQPPVTGRTAVSVIEHRPKTTETMHEETRSQTVTGYRRPRRPHTSLTGTMHGDSDIAGSLDVELHGRAMVCGRTESRQNYGSAMVKINPRAYQIPTPIIADEQRVQLKTFGDGVQLMSRHTTRQHIGNEPSPGARLQVSADFNQNGEEYPAFHHLYYHHRTPIVIHESAPRDLYRPHQPMTSSLNESRPQMQQHQHQQPQPPLQYQVSIDDQSRHHLHGAGTYAERMERPMGSDRMSLPRRQRMQSFYVPPTAKNTSSGSAPPDRSRRPHPSPSDVSGIRTDNRGVDDLGYWQHRTQVPRPELIGNAFSTDDIDQKSSPTRLTQYRTVSTVPTQADSRNWSAMSETCI